jgi:DNA-binding MarR family transcriptional regulator
MLVLLERGGLLSRRPHPTDGRARQVALTPKGRRALGRLWEASEAQRERLARLFDEKDGDALVAALRRVADAMSPPLPGRRTTTRRRITAARATVNA